MGFLPYVIVPFSTKRDSVVWEETQLWGSCPYFDLKLFFWLFSRLLIAKSREILTYRKNFTMDYAISFASFFEKMMRASGRLHAVVVVSLALLVSNGYSSVLLMKDNNKQTWKLVKSSFHLLSMKSALSLSGEKMC